MKLFVMNSAMMPQDGHYSRVLISAREFSDILSKANEVVSCVGYEAVSKMICNLTGKELPVNRDITVLDEESTILVAKLPYRIKDPSLKGFIDNEDPDKYEFLIVSYIKEQL